MKTRTKKEIRTKSGKVIPAGVNAEALPVQEGRALLLHTPHLAKPVYIRIGVAHTVLEGFNAPPSLQTLERWSEGGYSKTPVGKKVEEDGMDPEGWSSWHLLMGMV